MTTKDNEVSLTDMVLRSKELDQLRREVGSILARGAQNRSDEARMLRHTRRMDELYNERVKRMIANRFAWVVVCVGMSHL